MPAGKRILSRLRRPRLEMPGFISLALKERGLPDAYAARPYYQRNDYIGWIMRAKRQETRDSRLQQMLAELEQGGVYMKMEHPPSKKRPAG